MIKRIQLPAAPRTYTTLDAYSSVYRKRRCKTDWAGMGIGDAFKPNLDYYVRMSAQRLFYTACRKIQGIAVKHTGLTAVPGTEFKAKPQLGPCYTSYPPCLAACAAIGLTGFLEFQAYATGKLLDAALSEYLTNDAKRHQLSIDPKKYMEIAGFIVQIVQKRLLLEDVSRIPGMTMVELYRLFAASQQTMTFESVPEIIHAVILFGDVLPDWHRQVLHPMTRAMLRDLDGASRRFFIALSNAKPQDLVAIGIDWVKALCTAIAKYLPAPESTPRPSPAEEAAGQDDNQVNETESSCRFSANKQAPDTDSFAPLDGPHPPSLFGPLSAADRVAMDLLKNRQEQSTSNGEAKDGEQSSTTGLLNAFKHFSEVLNQAGGQSAKWEDMRSDMLEQAALLSVFSETPIQGNPSDGHEVNIHLGKDGTASTGEIFDRPVALSDDVQACDQLNAECQSMMNLLKRTLYPNISEASEADRLRTTGTLDARRLVMADYSPVIFKRNRIYPRADQRGQPVLLIACDGSGSLNSDQMKMLKVLTAAWLNATTRSRVQILAGLYHSGAIRENLSGPLVQWIFHPRKTPATSRRQAVRALVTLPNTGTGIQADALSLAYMLDEASSLARGRMIYMIIISDCAWNCSFNKSKSGQEEVLAFLETAVRDLPGKLHITLVALGVKAETGLEHVLDKVIAVPETEITNYAAVAEKIGVYVASCMKERRKIK